MERFAAQAPRPGNERMTAAARSALVDFLFTGVGVVPLTLAIAGSPDLALMLACPLLIGASLCALYLDGPAIGGDGRSVEPARRQPVPALLRPREAARAVAVDESTAAAWLVPLDGTPESMAAIEYVTAHARPERTRIHLLNVQPPVMAGDVSVLTSAEMIMRLRRCAGEDALRAATNHLRAHGFEHASDIVFGVAAEEIVRCADQRGCGKIVMSTRRTGAIASALGRSVAARVVRLAPVPVTIVKSRPPATSTGERFRFAWAR